LSNFGIIQKLLTFQEKEASIVVFFIPKIHCSSCIWLLENLYRLHDGVISVRVNFLKKEVKITFLNDKITLRQLAELLTQIGYEPAINLNDFEKDSHTPKNSNRELYYKVGVAGFAFGNVMLFSFPEYLGQVATEFKLLFGYLNIVLSIPVVLFSGQDYLKSAWQVLKQKQVNIDVPISLGIFALLAVSYYEILSQTGAGYLDSLAGLIFFLLIGRVFQTKTYDSLSFERDYKSYFPIAVTVLENQEERSIPIKNIKIGDRLLIHSQELVPADAIVRKGQAKMDYSFVTGESEVIPKNIDETLFAGGRQMGENIEIEVTKSFSQSYLTSLWNDQVFQKENSSGFDTLITIIGRRFTVFVIGVAVLSFFYHLPNIELAVKALSSVLIIACPCALALSSPFTLGSVLKFLGKNFLYLKNTDIIERLAQTDTIVFDKTGTLTYSNRADLVYEGEALCEECLNLIKTAVKQSTHPLSKQIYASDFLKNAKVLDVQYFEEFAGKGISANINGIQIDLGRLSFIAPGHGEPKDVGGANVFVSINNEFKGKFIVKNKYRKGIVETVKNLGDYFKIYVLSGDNEKERQNLEMMSFPTEHILFNQSPKDKLYFVRKLQKEEKNILMIGDGLNDAGALKESYVGLVITDDISAFTPASDGIIDSRFVNKLPQFIQFSKSAVKIIKTSLVLSLAYNLVGLSFATQGTLSPVISAILMPLSSISVVLFTTLSVFVVAKKLGLTQEQG